MSQLQDWFFSATFLSFSQWYYLTNCSRQNRTRAACNRSRYFSSHFISSIITRKGQGQDVGRDYASKTIPWNKLNHFTSVWEGEAGQNSFFVISLIKMFSQKECHLSLISSTCYFLEVNVIRSLKTFRTCVLQYVCIFHSTEHSSYWGISIAPPPLLSFGPVKDFLPSRSLDLIPACSHMWEDYAEPWPFPLSSRTKRRGTA